MIERLRKVFAESGKSQSEIARKTNVTPAYIWKILNNDNVKPRDLFIKTVCREFGINEDWLRIGEGEMYDIPEDEVSAVVSDLLEEDNPFYDLIVGIMKTYKKLDDKSKEVLKNLSKELLDNMGKREDN